MKRINGGRTGRVEVLCGLTALLLLLAGGCAAPGEKGAAQRYTDAETALYGIPEAKKPPEITDQSGVGEYIERALFSNQGLKAAFRRWKAALESVRGSKSLDDPVMSYEHSLDKKDFLQRFAVEQMIPLAGKLGLQGEAAVAEAEAAGYEFEARKLMVYGEVVTAFYDYNYLRRATAVTEENVQLLSDLESVVRTKYEAGSAGFADLIKLQVEQDRMKNELAAMVDERAAQSARLASLMDMPASNILPWPNAAPSGQTLSSDEGLMAMVRDLNPELKAADAMVQKAKAETEMARRSRYPDFMIGAGLMVMPGMDDGGKETETSVMAGLTLPVWQGKNSARIREAKSLLEAAERDRDELENRLEVELKMAVFQAKDAQRRVDLFTKSVIPKASQALEAARQEFSAGKADFMTLIDAQRTLLEFRLMYERAASDMEIAIAEIGCCIGMYGLPAPPDAATGSK